MDLLKRLNELTMVCLWVLDGVGMNLKPWLEWISMVFLIDVE